MNKRKLAVPSAFAAGMVAVIPLTAAADQTPVTQRVACATEAETVTKTGPSGTKEARSCCVKRYKGYCIKWGRCTTVCATTSVRG